MIDGCSVQSGCFNVASSVICFQSRGKDLCNCVRLSNGMYCGNAWLSNKLPDDTFLVVHEPLIWEASPNQPFGLITYDAIEMGVVLQEYVGVYSTTEPIGDNSYVMKLYHDRYVNAKEYGNLMRFVNHNDVSPNCKFLKRSINGREHVFVQAVVDIPAESYLSINYNW